MKTFRKALSFILIALTLSLTFNFSKGFGDISASAEETSNSFVKIFAGGNNSFGIKEDGSLWGWGYNEFGEIGDGTKIDRFSPKLIIAGDVTDISVGTYHSLAIKKDGSLWSWGVNNHGQLGDGTVVDRAVPKQIISSDVVLVAAGDYFSVAIKSDGSLWGWGSNNCGELGLGNAPDSSIPIQLMSSDVKAVTAGNSHTFIIKTDGSLWAWGNNGCGQLGNGTLDYSKTPIQIDINDVSQIKAVSGQTFAIKTDGSLWAWGYNANGQLGSEDNYYCTSPTQIIASDVKTIASGSGHSIALKNDGSLWIWGSNECNQLSDCKTDVNNRVLKPVQLIASGVKHVAAGALHSIIQKDDDSLWAWGFNEYGQLGDGTASYLSTPKRIFTSGIVDVSAGDSHTIALKTNGSVWAWGDNFYSQLGDGTLNKSIVPKQIISSGVNAISAGPYHNIVIKTDGSLWAWGNNDVGQLGDGTTTTSKVPKKIISSGVKAIAAGFAYTLALKTDGSLWAWGNNQSGQLGDGLTSSLKSPKRIISSGVIAISAGFDHSIILKSDGSVMAFGNNEKGQIGDGTNTNIKTPKKIISGSVKAIVASGNYSFAIKTDGSLLSWGSNWCGQLGNGTTKDCLLPTKIISSGVKAVSANASNGIAIKTDGSLWSWGKNICGGLGDGTADRNKAYLIPKQIISSGVTDIGLGNTDLFMIKKGGSLWAWGSNEKNKLGYGLDTTKIVKVVTELNFISSSTKNITMKVNEKLKFDLDFVPANFDKTETQWKIKSMSGDFNIYNESSSVFTADESGIVTMMVTNSAGTIIYKEFTINIFDSFGCYNVINNIIYYSDRKIILNSNTTATLNGVAMLPETVISKEGSYTLILSDSQKSSKTIKFIIAKISTPTGFKAISNSYNSINVTWNAVSGATGYTLYRFNNKTATYEYLVSVAQNSYINSSLNCGTKYYYKVYAYVIEEAKKIASPMTAIMYAVPVPAMTSAFSAVRASTSSIKLSWSAVAGASGYTIYRYNATKKAYLALTNILASSYINTGLTKNITYHYKVAAYRLVGSIKVYGGLSAYKSAKPY